QAEAGAGKLAPGAIIAGQVLEQPGGDHDRAEQAELLQRVDGEHLADRRIHLALAAVVVWHVAPSGIEGANYTPSNYLLSTANLGRTTRQHGESSSSSQSRAIGSSVWRGLP